MNIFNPNILNLLKFCEKELDINLVLFPILLAFLLFLDFIEIGDIYIKEDIRKSIWAVVVLFGISFILQIIVQHLLIYVN